MSALTDRERLELALPAALVWLVCRVLLSGSGLMAGGERIAAGLLERFHACAHEPFADLPLEDRERLRRRADREVRAVNEVLVQQPIQICLLAVHELLRQLLEAEVLVLHPDSAFETTWNDLLAWLFDGRPPAASAAIPEHIEAWMALAVENQTVVAANRDAGRQLGQKLLAACRQRGFYRAPQLAEGRAA